MHYINLSHRGRFLGQTAIPTQITDSAGTPYSIHSYVNGGGNGRVFRAFRGDPREQDLCAIKVLEVIDDTRTARFDNELRIQSALDHVNVARVLGSGSLTLQELAVPWMAIELGGSNLRRHLDGVDRIPARAALDIAVQVCDAVQHLHARGFIHRDIKPANFVTSTEDWQIKMIDFGIAKRLGEDIDARLLEDLTEQSDFVGPANFSSPELLQYSRDKTHPVDHRSDVFQAAKTIWFVAVNRISAGVPDRSVCPFEGSLYEIVLRCLADNPDHRPDSISAVAEQLRALR